VKTEQKTIEGPAGKISTKRSNKSFLYFCFNIQLFENPIDACHGCLQTHHIRTHPIINATRPAKRNNEAPENSANAAYGGFLIQENPPSSIFKF